MLSNTVTDTDTNTYANGRKTKPAAWRRDFALNTSCACWPRWFSVLDARLSLRYVHTHTYIDTNTVTHVRFYLCLLVFAVAAINKHSVQFNWKKAADGKNLKARTLFTGNGNRNRVKCELKFCLLFFFAVFSVFVVFFFILYVLRLRLFLSLGARMSTTTMWAEDVARCLLCLCL